ncbi:PAS domain-containing protein [Massilia brevitalea]|uniref:PAS domain-containing protein n=1 Tax=Massilia brevitalea TaxID=442526 RepID=UPI002738EDB0|nr:PAS domain-containing protein [Massilia brevitalea]
MGFASPNGHSFPPAGWGRDDLEALLDHIPAGIVIHGTDSRALYANRCARHLLGDAIGLMRRYPADSGAVPLLRPDGSPLQPALADLQRVSPAR